MSAIWSRKFFHQMKIENLRVDFWRIATRQCSRSIPAAATNGGQQALATHGKLTVHGVSRTVDIPMTGQVTGDKIEVVGSVAVDMTDYGIQTPSVGFTSVQPKVTIASLSGSRPTSKRRA